LDGFASYQNDSKIEKACKATSKAKSKGSQVRYCLMKQWEFVVLGTASVLLMAWINLIANQHSAPIILAAYFGSLFSAWLLLRRTALATKRVTWTVVGTALGFFFMALGGVMNECILRGPACVERDWTANMAVFPVMALGWVYGALLFTLTSQKNHR
jgi:hypothetical protein